MSYFFVGFWTLSPSNVRKSPNLSKQTHSILISEFQKTLNIGHRRYENLNTEVYFGGPIKELTILMSSMFDYNIVHLDTNLIRNVRVTLLKEDFCILTRNEVNSFHDHEISIKLKKFKTILESNWTDVKKKFESILLNFYQWKSCQMINWINLN